ncbi:pyridoxal phosphate-dependent decarboxylase family protein [Prochlorothrix hollandica]|uniref:pyridoxal phosphate-dependent decarboxylase family protein n=1 Tax=Prochlorothrix hollandica TaxID=1223 RepID=UPI001CED393B|nr:pyridoxal-dependent decarboxylase [Prochlorothrix hollandica]
MSERPVSELPADLPADLPAPALPLSPLPLGVSETAFIDPQGGNRGAIAALLQDALHLLLDHSTQAAQGSPLPPLQPWQLPTAIPQQGQDPALLFHHLQSLMAQSMNPAHPGYLGHMDPPATTLSLVGDLLAAVLNNNMLAVEMSPVFSRLEPLVLQELAQGFGFGAGSGGLLLSGGTLANLQALTVARNVQLPPVRTQGLGAAGRPVVLASAVAHTSWRKATMVLGLGSEALIPVATNDESQMDLGDLERQYQGAIAAGQRPFALVATAGTTVTGNIDPLPALAAFAQAQGLWFHVDAAYGGALIFSPEQRHRLQGIDQADSITFNPQKWLYVTKTCAMVLFRQMDRLQEAFHIAAPYMGRDGDWRNLGEVSVQGTRHVDILKLWLSLQHLGHQGYGALIAASYDLTDYLRRGLEQRSFLHLASGPELNILCFRGQPQGLDPAVWDDWNRNLQQFLLKEADCFLSLPLYRGSLWLKVVLLNPHCDRAILDRLLAGIDRYAALTLPS